LKKDLTKDNLELIATNPTIIIEYINDECCEPEDKNVIFTPDYQYKISTKDNKNDYFKNWNCSACATSLSTKMRKPMDLQSRRLKQDLCYLTRKDDFKDCAKCELVSDGQFCYPGNYTLQFKTESQCEDVTFGECDIPQEEFITYDDKLKGGLIQTAESKCNERCSVDTECLAWRFNRQTNNCTLWETRYKSEYCNIRAAPKDKSTEQCLFLDNNRICDTIVEEDCEYNGELLKGFRKGSIASPDACQRMCEKTYAPDCKYWIYKDLETECILKKDGKKKCSIVSGEKMTLNDYQFCEKKFNKVK